MRVDGKIGENSPGKKFPANITAYLEVIEDKPYAEDVWINSNKVRPLRVHNHLDALTAQGKVVLL